MTRPLVPTPVHPQGSTFAYSAQRRQEGDHGIGVRRRKSEGAEKATGRIKYADDIQLPGMLHCKENPAPEPACNLLIFPSGPSISGRGNEHGTCRTARR